MSIIINGKAALTNDGLPYMWESGDITTLPSNEVKVESTSTSGSTSHGFSVAAGTKLVVGDYKNNADAGVARVYNLDGSLNTTITGSDTVAGDKFGYSVDVGSLKMISGAPGDDSSKGSAYGFDITGVQDIKLTASDGVAGDEFGKSVSAGCGKFVVGAPSYNGGIGRAYIYNTDGTGEIALDVDLEQYSYWKRYDSKGVSGSDPGGDLDTSYTKDDLADRVLVDNDGNTILCWEQKDVTNSIKRCYYRLIKMDPQGNEIWHKIYYHSTFEPSNYQQHNRRELQVLDIVCDSSNNYYAAILLLDRDELNNDDSLEYPSSVDTDLSIIKFNSSGNIVWQRMIHGDDSGTYLNASLEAYSYSSRSNYLKLVNNTDLVFTATWARSIPFGVTYTQTNFWNNDGTTVSTHGIYLVKYDLNGTKQYERKIRSEDYLLNARRIDVDNAGNIYIIGNIKENFVTNYDAATYSYTPDIGDFVQNVFICKIDSSGTIQWAKMFGNTRTDYYPAWYLVDTTNYNSYIDYAIQVVVSNKHNKVYLLISSWFIYDDNKYTKSVPVIISLNADDGTWQKQVDFHSYAKEFGTTPEVYLPIKSSPFNLVLDEDEDHLILSHQLEEYYNSIIAYGEIACLVKLDHNLNTVSRKVLRHHNYGNRAYQFSNTPGYSRQEDQILEARSYVFINGMIYLLLRSELQSSPSISVSNVGWSVILMKVPYDFLFSSGRKVMGPNNNGRIIITDYDDSSLSMFIFPEEYMESDPDQLPVPNGGLNGVTVTKVLVGTDLTFTISSTNEVFHDSSNIVREFTADTVTDPNEPYTATSTPLDSLVVEQWSGEVTPSSTTFATAYNEHSLSAGMFKKFGSSVSIGNGRVAVGAPEDSFLNEISGYYYKSGSVYLYNTYGVFLKKLYQPNPRAADYFGHQVSVGSNRIVASAYNKTVGSNASQGVVYVYDLNGNYMFELVAPDGAANDRFGWSVSVGNGRICCFTPYHNSSTGKGYIFDIDGRYLTSITATGASVDDEFGYSVSVGSGKILVGSPKYDSQSITDLGSSYIFSTPRVYTLNDSVDLTHYG